MRRCCESFDPKTFHVKNSLRGSGYYTKPLWMKKQYAGIFRLFKIHLLVSQYIFNFSHKWFILWIVKRLFVVRFLTTALKILHISWAWDMMTFPLWNIEKIETSKFLMYFWLSCHTRGRCCIYSPQKWSMWVQAWVNRKKVKRIHRACLGFQKVPEMLFVWLYDKIKI